MANFATKSYVIIHFSLLQMLTTKILTMELKWKWKFCWVGTYRMQNEKSGGKSDSSSNDMEKRV